MNKKLYPFDKYNEFQIYLKEYEDCVLLNREVDSRWSNNWEFYDKYSSYWYDDFDDEEVYRKYRK
jgi:hypothetical protein